MEITKENFDIVLKKAQSLGPTVTYDYKGNPVMTGVDYRNTSFHYNKGTHWT